MKTHVLISAVLVTATLALPATAQIQFNLNFGPPPTMLYLPQPGVYSAVGVPYEIYFVGDRYYYYRDSNWFWAPGYGGPWTYVSYRSLPPGLRNYGVATLRNYRDREYRVYRVDSSRFDGRHFVARYGPGNRGRGYARGRR